MQVASTVSTVATHDVYNGNSSPLLTTHSAHPLPQCLNSLTTGSDIMCDGAASPQREASSNRCGRLMHVVRMHVDGARHTLGRGMRAPSLYLTVRLVRPDCRYRVQLLRYLDVAECRMHCLPNRPRPYT